MPFFVAERKHQFKIATIARKKMAGKKGKSGRKKKHEEALNYLGDEVKNALQRVGKLAKNKKAPHSVRLEADKLLIEQALGKPSQRHELTGEEGGPMEFKHGVKEMSDDELHAHITRELAGRDRKAQSEK